MRKVLFAILFITSFNISAYYDITNDPGVELINGKYHIDNINQIIDSKSGETIFFPKGVYIISEMIDLNTTNSGTTLVGDGRTSTTLQWDNSINGNFQSVIKVSSVGIDVKPDDRDGLKFVKYITIKNLSISANNTADYALYTTDIQFAHIENISIGHSIKHNWFGCLIMNSIFKNIHSIQGQNCGITLGKALESFGNLPDSVICHHLNVDKSEFNYLYVADVGLKSWIEPLEYYMEEPCPTDKGYGLLIGNTFGTKFYNIVAEHNWGVGVYIACAQNPIYCENLSFERNYHCKINSSYKRGDAWQIYIENGAKLIAKDVHFHVGGDAGKSNGIRVDGSANIENFNGYEIQTNENNPMENIKLKGAIYPWLEVWSNFDNNPVKWYSFPSQKITITQIHNVKFDHSRIYTQAKLLFPAQGIIENFNEIGIFIVLKPNNRVHLQTNQILYLNIWNLDEEPDIMETYKGFRLKIGDAQLTHYGDTVFIPLSENEVEKLEGKNIAICSGAGYHHDILTYNYQTVGIYGYRKE